MLLVAASGASRPRCSPIIPSRCSIRRRKSTLKGVVHEFQWTNPHAFIHIEVPNDSGGKTCEQVELNSPNNLTRQGWKSIEHQAWRRR